jgi:hypothetical protein
LDHRDDRIEFHFPENFNPRSRQGERPSAKMFKKKKRPHKRATNEVTYFEIDRSTVSSELQNLKSAIEEGAKQIEMVAAERVFDRSLSAALVRKARELHLVARDLKGLLKLVARARMPKTP